MDRFGTVTVNHRVVLPSVVGVWVGGALLVLFACLVFFFFLFFFTLCVGLKPSDQSTQIKVQTRKSINIDNSEIFDTQTWTPKQRYGQVPAVVSISCLL